MDVQGVLVDRRPPGEVRDVFDIVCGAIAEAATGGRPGSARGASSSGRSQHKPILDLQVVLAWHSS
jgi:hypothetical protein